LLQHVQLGDWHPARDILKTAETTEQQRMSSDSVSQWAQACIEADEIVGMALGPHGIQTTLDLGAPHSTKTLHDAYTGYCKQNSLRPKDLETFGKACTDMFGPRGRLRALQTNTTGNSKRRPWGYHVPKGNKWQEKVDARLGIKN
jgi:phage/plasmid-associated DNA primase